MSLLDMVPSSRNSLWQRPWGSFSPLFDLQRDLSRMAEDVTRTFERNNLPVLEGGFPSFMPQVDVKEEKETILVIAELPGMNEKDIEVTLTDGAITLKGEKKTEKEEKRKDYYRMERSYGAFERVIDLPCEVENNKAEATFKNGVLTIHVPKSAQAKVEAKKLHIKVS